MLTSLPIALAALRRNKARTTLTVIGVVIGIGAVIAVMSAGQGIEGLVLAQVETFGTDVIDIEIKVPTASKTSSENAMGIATGIEITTLTLDDEAALRKLSNVKNSYAGVMGQQLVSYGGQNKQVYLMGVSPSFIEIDKTKVAEGRFFTADEDASLANVAVIGPKVREKIFGESDFLDQLLKIGHQKFRVIGLLESRGATFGFDMDDKVYDNSIADQTADEITQVLRQRHEITDPDKDDFHATPMAEALEILGSVFWAITLLLIAVAGISLVVGGVGIMNIMYVSVLERTYEIGLRKAIGAKSSAILTQFLWEAILITLLGAVLGIVFGIALAWLVAVIATSQNFAWRFVVMPSSRRVASGGATAIGRTCGVFPARAAAKMDPVTALRYNR